MQYILPCIKNYCLIFFLKVCVALIYSLTCLRFKFAHLIHDHTCIENICPSTFVCNTVASKPCVLNLLIDAWNSGWNYSRLFMMLIWYHSMNSRIKGEVFPNNVDCVSTWASIGGGGNRGTRPPPPPRNFKGGGGHNINSPPPPTILGLYD